MKWNFGEAVENIPSFPLFWFPWYYCDETLTMSDLGEERVYCILQLYRSLQMNPEKEHTRETEAESMRKTA